MYLIVSYTTTILDLVKLTLSISLEREFKDGVEFGSRYGMEPS